MKYAGADWVRDSMRIEGMSSLGKKVANILGNVYLGIYHMRQNDLDKVDWKNDRYIVIRIRDELSTYDFNRLTLLVIACHEEAVRVEISGRAKNHLQLMFHKRRRNGSVFERHPTIEQAIASYREAFSE
jgi:hypothetical protein